MAVKTTPSAPRPVPKRRDDDALRRAREAKAEAARAEAAQSTASAGANAGADAPVEAAQHAQGTTRSARGGAHQAAQANTALLKKTVGDASGVEGGGVLGLEPGGTQDANIRAGMAMLGLEKLATASTPEAQKKAFGLVREALGFSPERHLDGDTMGALSDAIVARDRSSGADGMPTNEVVNTLRTAWAQMEGAEASGRAGASGPATSPGQYSVRSGDTLSAIAQRSGVSLQQLIAANPQIKNPDLIYPGNGVNIPAGGRMPSSGRAPVSLQRAGPIDTANWTPGGGDVTPDQLTAIAGQAGHSLTAQRAAEVAPHLNVAMREAGIDTPRKKAAFVAQLMHESGGFRYNEEIASGAAYEGRRNLGNTQPGDGRRFKGRGFIQLTGRANYESAGRALGLDLVNNPELAATDANAARVAAWYWNSRGLNETAERGDFDTVTRRINGGLNGKADRDRLYAAASTVLADNTGLPSTGQLTDAPAAGRSDPTAPTAATANMSTEERYNHYRGLIEARGGTVNDAPGQRSIVGVRNENHGVNAYDDQMAVIWRDENGQPQVREFPANMESISRYQGRFGNDVNGDGSRDLASLAEGTYSFSRDHSSRYGNILRPDSTTAVMRDTDRDGRGDTLDRTGAGRSILFHKGGYNDTGSAGCQTMPPDVFNAFWRSLGNDNNVSYTLVNAD